MDLARARVEAAHVQWEWNRVFGREYLGLVEAEQAHVRFTELRALAEQHPGATEEELAALAAEQEAARLEHLAELELDVVSAPGRERAVPILPHSASQEQVAAYHRAVRAALLELRALTHPARWTQQEAYRRLTAEQTTMVQGIFLKYSTVKRADIGYREGQIGRSCPALHALQADIATVRQVLTAVGVSPLSDRKKITISERLEALREDRLWVRIQRGEAMAELAELENDPELILRREHLDRPERTEAIKAELVAAAERARAEVTMPPFGP